MKMQEALMDIVNSRRIGAGPRCDRLDALALAVPENPERLRT